MSSNEEKRKLSRIDSNIKAQVKYNEKFFAGEIINFSLNGFLFSLDENANVSADEKVAIIIDWGEETKDLSSDIDCIVVRQIDNILGLKFEVIDYDTLMLLKQKLIHLIGDEDRINDAFISFLVGN